MTDLQGILMVCQLKQILEEAGYQTSWQVPFARGAAPCSNCGPGLIHLDFCRFYITGLPVSKIAPFDFVEVQIETVNSELFFAMIFHFEKVMEGLMEPEEFHAIIDQHDRAWFPKLVDCFSGIESTHNLKWDMEHDVAIEDTLYGRFELNSSSNLTRIIRTLEAY